MVQPGSTVTSWMRWPSRAATAVARSNSYTGGTGEDGTGQALADRRHHRTLALAPGHAGLEEARGLQRGHVPASGRLEAGRVAHAAEEALTLGDRSGEGGVGRGLLPPHGPVRPA